MAAQESTVPMDDKALMEGALAAEPVREEKPAEPPQEPERPRDELGRFAAKEEDDKPKSDPPQIEPQPEKPEDKEEGQVPSWRLREYREERDAAAKRAEEAERRAFAIQQQFAETQRQLAELRKPKQEPVDFFQNPDEAFQQRLNPLEERMAQFETKVRLTTSRAMAVAMHGAPAVQEMEQAIEKASQSNHPDIPALAAQMRASDDPVNVAMQWHKRTKLWETTGGDPDAYRQKILDDAMKDPEFQAKVLDAARTQAGGQPNTRPLVNIPPSLSRAAGTGATEPVGLTAADMSDASLYAHATAKGGRR